MDCGVCRGYAVSAPFWKDRTPTMTVQVAVPIDDARLECARSAATARGMTVESYIAELVRLRFPLVEQPAGEHRGSRLSAVRASS
jgi:hypothetical protein